MIQFDKDGVTLFYIDANGNRVAHGPFDGQAYTDMLTIRGAEQAAATTNTMAVTNYNNVLANVQTMTNEGLINIPPAPAKPLQMVVADANGAVTYVPFVPPLADLIPLVSIPSGSIAAPSLDKETIMYNMISAIFRKEFPDA
jgi:hypothetical protein